MTDAAGTAVRANPLRRLYNWVLRNAEGPHAWAVLALVAFAEASFFPVPPDVMVIPMALAQRRRAFVIGAWCSLWSVIGGLFGYAIGAFLYNSIGHFFVSPHELGMFRVKYAQHAYLLLFQGFTPIPFKLITIASGFVGLSLPTFILYSAITRSARFMLEAAALYLYGEPVREFLEKWLEYLLVLGLVLIIVGYLIVRYAM